MADDEATEKVDLEIQVDGSKSKSQTSKRKWAVYASIGLIFLLLIIAFLWPLWATAPSSKMYSNTRRFLKLHDREFNNQDFCQENMFVCHVTIPGT